MKTIKDQISKLIIFKASDINSLTEEYSIIRDRLAEGLDKMKTSNIYSTAEIEEIRIYIYDVLNSRYAIARNDVRNKLRSEFTF